MLCNAPKGAAMTVGASALPHCRGPMYEMRQLGRMLAHP